MDRSARASYNRKRAYRDLDGGGGGGGGGGGDDHDALRRRHVDTKWAVREAARRSPPRAQQPPLARLLLAITLDDATRLHLCGLPLSHIAMKRHIDERDLHMTLNFIGLEDADKVHDALKDVQFSELRLRVKGVGAFPSRKLPLTLWAGVQADDTLYELQAAVKERLRRHGVRVSDKHDEYRPHVTVGWVVRSDAALAAAREFVLSNEQFEGGWFTVRDLALMQTIQRAQRRGVARSAYVVRRRYALAARAAPPQ